MSFLLWQRESDIAIASARLVLRADEVPALRQALALRDELEALHRDAQQRLAAAADAARTQGHAEGLAEGRAAARDEVAATLAALAADAEQERAQLRGEVAQLALQVARKLIGALAGDERLVALAATAAREALPEGRLALAVHPARADAVRARLASSRDDAYAALADVDVRADETCAPDDCRLDTELGSIDASPEAQLDRLAQAWGVAA
jgi:flagellar biosynthesis/type III secretory pathway protein FliH